MIMANGSCNCGFGPVAAKPYYPCGVREVMTRNKRFIRYFSVAVIKHWPKVSYKSVYFNGRFQRDKIA